LSQGRQNPLRRAVVAFFARVMRTQFAQRHISPHFAPMQQWIYHRTGNRLQISALLMPTLILYTTGAKSGKRRETPLICFPEDGGRLLVAGSNWGKPHHPAWTANLMAHPDAEVVYKRRSIRVHAELLSAAEREAVWPQLEAQFPGYRKYEDTAEREVRVFRLTPRP
jgi:deazaflavin-dependent oxidoreductase (nitroreductase family)